VLRCAAHLVAKNTEEQRTDCMSGHGKTIGTLSEFVTSVRFEDLPDETIARAEVILLDTLGAILSATLPRYVAGQRLFEFIMGLGGTPECALIGRRERSSTVNAALFNGTLGYYSDIEAHHPEAIMHAAAITVPTALALAEREGRSGADLLTAIVVGVDVACRVSNAIGPSYLYSRGQHPTCVAGGFGAAAAAGYLLGFDPARMRRAWGLTGTQASGLLAWETDPTENSRPFNPGIAARNGTTAAVLASYDFGGPPDIFEGKFNIFGAFSDQPRLDQLTSRLGERFLINELAIKRYACCAFLHPGLDGLDEILVAQGLEAEEIDAIRLRFPRSGVALIDDNPLRSHCGQYILPIYALERKVIIDDILIDRRTEPPIAALSAKTQVLADDGLDPEFPERYTTIIEVDSRGSTFSRRVPYAKGCPENPLTDDEVDAKFRWLAGTVRDDQPVEAFIDSVRSIAATPSVKGLAAQLQFQPRSPV
jgi:2-methylcitrate dehydratase PrpD